MWICSSCVDVKIGRCEDVRVSVARDRQGMLYRRCEKYKHTEMLIGSHTQTHTHAQKLLHTEAFTHRRFTQMCLHADAFTHRHFCTHKRFIHAEAFTPTHTHTRARSLLHTNIFTRNIFTHKRFYTQTLWYTDHFTHKHFKRFTHRPFRTQRLLHTNALTHRPFYTQKLLTQTRLHTNSFNYTQALVHANPLTGPTKLAKKNSFGHSNLVSCKRVAAGPTKLAKNPQFLTLKPRFGTTLLAQCTFILLLGQTVEPREMDFETVYDYADAGTGKLLQVREQATAVCYSKTRHLSASLRGWKDVKSCAYPDESDECKLWAYHNLHQPGRKRNRRRRLCFEILKCMRA